MSTPTRTRPLRVALVGNPNCGKTTVFNALTGLSQKVGNYPGVTVERRVGVRKRPGGEILEIVDIPGTYSLGIRSPDEAVAVNLLMGRLPGERSPDVIVNVVDASNLARNLFLTSQLLELDRPMVVVLNMMDVARRRGLVPDARAMEEALGVPVVPLENHGAEAMDAVAAAVERVAQSPPPKPVVPVEGALSKSLADLEGSLRGRISRAAALLALEGEETLDSLDSSRLDEVRAALESEDPNWWKREAGARYRWIDAHLPCFLEGECKEPVRPDSGTANADRILLHRFFGPLIFLGVMAFVFQGIFTWASVPSDLLESGFNALSALVGRWIGPGMFHDFILGGVLSGVLNVLVFLPQIVILFLFIGFLEDSGYMARGVFIMDRLMRRFGLHGRAFVPLMSSFACAVPGIMSTRTIGNPVTRLTTILVAPLMSCSARLPVYTLVIAAFFGSGKVLGVMSTGGLVLLVLYALGIAAAALMSVLFRRFLVKGEPPALLMELPPYRMPRPGAVLRQTWVQSLLFVKKVWTVILIVTATLWFLQTFPRDESRSAVAATQIEAIESALRDGVSPEIRERLINEKRDIQDGLRSAQLEQSFAGVVGKAIEPVIRPLGFDWRIGIGLLASFAAREVLVSTMAQVFAVGADDEDVASLASRFRSAKDPRTGRLLYSPLTGISLAVFFVLACQCMSTLAIVRRETGTWRWPAFLFGYMTILAWVGSFLTYQLGSLWMA